MFEEIGSPYEVIAYDIFEGDQLTADFGRINPNHKLPAIIDRTPSDGDDQAIVFESAAILQYLAEKSGRFLAQSGAARATTLSWLTWQAANLGPMGGQASHFLRYAPRDQDYATARYTGELQRLLDVLEKRLSDCSYVAGDTYSIADIAIWPGRASAFVLGLSMDDYPATQRWFNRIRERPAVVRALGRPELAVPAKYTGRHQKLTARQWANMFGAATRNSQP